MRASKHGVSNKCVSFIVFTVIEYMTRNSSGDEIANVELPYIDIVHALQ